MEKTIKFIGADTLKTEIFFTIAEARSKGETFLRLDFSAEDGERAERAARRILRAGKKAGLLLAFAGESDFKEENTSAAYLSNLCPALSPEAREGRPYFFIKI